MTVCGHTACLYLTHHAIGLLSLTVLWTAALSGPQLLCSSLFHQNHLNVCLPQIHKHSGTAASIWLLPLLYQATQTMLLSFLTINHPPSPGCRVSATQLGPFSLAEPIEEEISLVIFLRAAHMFQCYSLSDLLIHWLCITWVDVAFISCKWNMGGKEPGDGKPFVGDSLADVWQKAE